MKCVVLMFDSLNRHMLAPYGCDWTHTPNFSRLAERSATFDRSYVCSMPCMPARRDMHTGRPGFLHRSWGPLEPFDDSVFDMLRHQRGIHTHLATDHYHYFEDGGANYHNRYTTYEFFRGQEGDQWIGLVGEPDVPTNVNGKGRRQDWVNRPHMQPDEKHCQSRTIEAGLTFIDRNAAEDDWLLQVECFDPHEPFFCDEKWNALFPSPDGDEPLYDWPDYGKVPEDPKLVDQARRRYAALLAKCDDSLGKVLDAFDRHGLWDDTMLVVCTDHGILLGEHGWMMKNLPPLYEEVSHTPLFIHDPRHASAGQRRAALVQPAIDLPLTLLDFFGAEPTERMLGKSLTPA
ncbi:MAG: sulfatase, partial [Planctomycetota bacterium]